MNSLVIYNSSTGFTKKYATWISEETQAQCISYKESKKMDLSGYDTIVLGSWVFAGSVDKLNGIKNILKKYPDKKFVVYIVGATPQKEKDAVAALKKAQSDLKIFKAKVFYLPGGFNHENMSFLNKMMLKVLAKSIEAKTNKTENDEIMLERLSSSFDSTDRAFITPIVSAIKEQ